MRANEFITESKSAPIYHFTLYKHFVEILRTNTLKARRPGISFTRDITRTFIPANIVARPIGFRVDQEKLVHEFGRKLAPAVNTPSKSLDQIRKDYPGIDKHISDYKKTGNSSMRINDQNVKDLANGTTGMSSRFESEERLMVDEIPNFLSYVTGIVICADSKDYGANNDKFIGNINKACYNLAQHFTHAFDMEQRSFILDGAIATQIPLIWQGKTIQAQQVKDAMINIYRARKRDPELAKPGAIIYREKAEREAEAKKAGMVWPDDITRWINKNMPYTKV
jgi:hypothetical protein